MGGAVGEEQVAGPARAHHGVALQVHHVLVGLRRWARRTSRSARRRGLRAAGRRSAGAGPRAGRAGVRPGPGGPACRTGGLTRSRWAVQGPPSQASWLETSGTATDITPARDQERQRIQVQGPVLKAGPGLPDVEMRTARGAAQQAAARRPARARCSDGPGHRPGASGAVVAVRIEILPGPACQHRVAAHHKAGNLALLQAGDLGDRLPGSRGVFLPVTGCPVPVRRRRVRPCRRRRSGCPCHRRRVVQPDQQRVHRNHAGSGRAGFLLHHLDGGHLRCRRLDGLLDGELERDRRRRAALAGAEQPEPHHAFRADVQKFHIAAVRAQVGPDAVQCGGHPCLQVLGVQPVDHQQAGHQLVRGQCVQGCAVQLAAVVEDFQDPGQSGAVQVRHLADQFLRAAAGHRPAGSEGVEETFDPVAGLPRPVLARHGSYSPVRVWVGECSFSRVWPLPRYMWTPQGRQGSKLRTVRMMSMPLKCSRSFSSKIGWPCTASS